MMSPQTQREGRRSLDRRKHSNRQKRDENKQRGQRARGRDRNKQDGKTERDRDTVTQSETEKQKTERERVTERETGNRDRNRERDRETERDTEQAYLSGRLVKNSGLYVCDFAFDVLQQVLLSPEEVWVLELCVVPLRLQQAAVLDVHHLPEAVWTETHRGGGTGI